MTKHLYERGLAESKKAKRQIAVGGAGVIARAFPHLILLITGVAWIVAFKSMDPNSKWGQVVGNIVSEWTQILGLVPG